MADTPDTRRLKLTIAYDGTPYQGWQSQKSGEGIQDIVEAALAKVCKKPVRLHGAGRTDAGVHALAQVAHVDVSANLTPLQWVRATNTHLPPEIRLMRVQQVHDDFHARFSAKGKIYRYEVYTGEVQPPHLYRTTWHHYHDVDVKLLRAAASSYVGTHDFSGFSANRGTPVEDTRRTIHRIQVTSSGAVLRVTYAGDGFLYKMVRMLTGEAFRVANGRETLRSLRERLQNGGPRSQQVAPAKGLTLVRVIY